jgi:predicted O-methyltransferase YrrM
MDIQFTWEDIPGFFDFKDFYDEQISRVSNGAKFVEVGTHYGKSSIYMATAIKASGKNIEFTTVDSYNHPRFFSSEKMFKHFVEITNTQSYIKQLVMDQLEAAKVFKDNSLDFVFLDADHSFDGTLNAIKAFLPKLKNGGVIAGDDYDIIGFSNVVKAVQQGLPNFKLQNRIFYYVK